MRRLIDVSGVIENDLWGYHALPGLEHIVPHVELHEISNIQTNGFFASKLTMSTISGVYVEAGSHILENGRTLDTYSLNDFIKPFSLIRLEEQQPGAVIDVDQLENASSEIHAGEAIIIDTGWWRMWNKAGFVETTPTYSPAAIRWIIEKHPSIFAVDVPCIESSWNNDEEDQKGSLLGLLFEHGSLLVAPLSNLGSLNETKGMIYCIPLLLKGTSGSPARVFLETGKEEFDITKEEVLK